MTRRNPLIRIYLAMAALVGVIVVGTVGYMLIEQFRFLDALYMCVITLASVGFLEVHPLSDSGRWFTMLLIFANFAVVGFIVTVVTRYVLDGAFIHSYKLYNMTKTIETLSEHIIICGYGRNGSEAEREIRGNGYDCVVIERNFKNKNIDGLRYYLEADATQDEILREAGIGRAKVLICSLPDDSDNVFIVLTARELNPLLTIISRASQDSSVRKLKIAGADNVIMPDKIGGSQMASLIIRPDVKEFLDLLADDITNNCAVIELTLSQPTTLRQLDCWSRTGATPLGIKLTEGEYIVNPSPDSPLRPGDRLIVMGSATQVQALRVLI